MNRIAGRSYADAKDWIAKGRSGTDRPIANNTRLIDRGDSIALRLHSTDVVTLHDNGDLSFDSGGWRTVTTKDRMGYAGRDYSIFSDKGVWYITSRRLSARIEKNLRRKYGLPITAEEHGEPAEEYMRAYVDSYGLVHLGGMRPRAGGWGWWTNVEEAIGTKDAYRIYRAFHDELAGRTTYLFFDGIRFGPGGKCLNGINPDEAKRQVAQSERERKRIREFAKYAVTRLDDGMPVIDRGDCFYCQMRTVDEKPREERHGLRSGSLRGRPLGDATENHEHLESHIEEGYVPSSLILNAMDEQSYTDMGKSLWLGIHEDDNGELRMGGFVTNDYGTRRRHSPDQVAKAVYEYVARRLTPDREVRGNFTGQNSLSRNMA